MGSDAVEVSAGCEYAAGALADVLCEFCNIPICLACLRCNSFGNCCSRCHADVESGVIDDDGFREASPNQYHDCMVLGLPYETPGGDSFRCGGEQLDSASE